MNIDKLKAAINFIEATTKKKVVLKEATRNEEFLVIIETTVSEVIYQQPDKPFVKNKEHIDISASSPVKAVEKIMRKKDSRHFSMDKLQKFPGYLLYSITTNMHGMDFSTMDDYDKKNWKLSNDNGYMTKTVYKITIHKKTPVEI